MDFDPGPRHLHARSMKSIHFLLIDDHPVVRMGMRALIQTQYPWASIAEAASPQQVEACLATRAPDISLLDIHLAQSNGLDLIRDLRRYNSKVLVLSLRDEWSVAQAALNAGADGYLVKDAAGNELSLALEAIQNGMQYVPPKWRARWDTPTCSPKESPVAQLSPRELEVLWLVGRGKSKTEIGKLLCISPNTAETHRQNLRQKLHLENHHELVKFALIHTHQALPLPPSSATE